MGTTVGILHEHLVFNRRTRVLAAHLSALMPRDASVLDVGCGDGTIDTLMLNQRPDISIRGVDILVRPTTKIPVDPFDGERLPCADKSFERRVLCGRTAPHERSDRIAQGSQTGRAKVRRHQGPHNGWMACLRDIALHGLGRERASRGRAAIQLLAGTALARDISAFLGMSIARWKPNVGLYPFPASLVFGRGLHFVAAIEAA